MVCEIDVYQLAAKLSANEPVYLLDVRQPWENQLAALPGSKLVPLNQLAARAAEVQPPAGCTVVVYCHHGVRSRSGAALLQQLGVPNVVSLAGGLDAWSLEIDPGVPRY
jgi:rhodanese-related sulfurtransferase